MKRSKQGARSQGRALLSAMVLAVAAVVAGCGGGGSQIEAFKPNRIISFGDEASLITSEGKKYSINAVDTNTGLIVCTANPIWVQTLASTFGLVYPNCNPDKLAVPTGRMYSQSGAKVADVKTQIDNHFTSGGFNAKDLVTVMVGVNDVLELYKEYPRQSEAALKTLAGQRGRDLAAQVNRIANADGRVIIVSLPDLGVTPFALNERLTRPDTDRAKLLTALTQAFNDEMRANIINDGRLVGLVILDEEVDRLVRYPSAYGFANVTEQACQSTVSVPECSNRTLATNASGDTWLWANSTLLSPAGQARLASLAQSRAVNNPF